MTNHGIISNTNQSEGDAESRQDEFEALCRELAEKELERATLENELAIFERRYARIIGVLFAELDELEKDIANELLRLHPEEKYQRYFQDAERRARTSRDSVNEKLDQAEKQKFIPSEELKNLFRKIAKTIHPDLASSEDERAYRTILMAKANIAYRNGDIGALEQILVEWEQGKKNLAPEDIQLESDPLVKKIHQIKLRISVIESDIAELKKSELYLLMQKVDQTEKEGGDLLGDMAKNLEQQIQEAKARLDQLKQQR